MTLQSKRKTIGLRRFILTPMLLILASVSAAAQTNTFPTTGNAGAGTTSPDRKLEVLDSGSPQLRLTHTGGSAYTDFQTLSTGNLIISPTGPDTTSPKPFTVSAGSDAFRFYPTADTNLRWSLSTDASGLFNIVQRGDGWANQGTRLSINRSGNVGIGTTSPIYTLDVNGGVNGFRARAATTSSSDAIATFENSSGIQAIVRGNGNVGIGTLNPAFDANVTKYLALDGGSYLGSIGVGGNITSTSHPVGQYAFFNSGLSGSEKRVATIVGGTDLATNSGKIDFWTTSAGSFGSGPKMTIFSNGNVGINTNNPAAYKLDVNGEINATGIRINGIPISGGGSSQWTTSGSNIYYNSGNVGVGLASPRTYAALDISTSNSKSLYTMDSTNGGLLIGYQGSTIQARQTNDGNNQNLILQNWGGNVGVGTATPAYKLHVQGGQINASGGLCIAGDCKTAWSQIGGGGSSQWSDGANSTIHYNTGNVGIGTTNPSQKLEVYNASGPTYFKATSGSAGTYLGTDGTNSYLQAVSPNQKIFLSRSDGSALFTADTSTGNVGIGTTSPNNKLDVHGNFSVTGGGTNDTVKVLSTSSVSGGAFIQNTQPSAQAVMYVENNRGSFASYGGFLYGGSNNAIGNLFGVSRTDKMFLFADGASNLGMAVGTLAAQPLILGTSNTERMRVDSTGNVGIGTTPGALYRLDVQGKINSSELCIATDCKSSWSQVGGGGGSTAFSAITAGTNTLALVVGNGGSLGVSGTGTINATSLTNAANITGGTVPIARLGTDTPDSTKFLRGDNTWTAITSSQWANGSGNINYTSGNVGIGTSSPASGYKLDVNGNTNVTGSLNVTGNINAKYQDLAEWVPSSEKLSAGTVVVLDTAKSNQVISSTTGYDTRVAGVISAQPGITLGEGGEGKVLVATTGRVRVKVDASRGPIQIGDLLVTSDVSGVAMKSEPVEFAGRKMHMPGTIIGKALEPLAKGSGEILVLLSLQ